jgi:hypothetical protein
MSNLPPISVHPDSEAQVQQIKAQARKHDESVSEYCLMAIEQRIARETEAERLDELNIGTRLDDLQTAIIEDIQDATDIETEQELCYEIALWKLFGTDHSREMRRQAMEEAPDQLDKDLERLAAKEGGDD